MGLQSFKKEVASQVVNSDNVSMSKMEAGRVVEMLGGVGGGASGGKGRGQGEGTGL